MIKPINLMYQHDALTNGTTRPGCMMKYLAVQLHPDWDLSHPFVQYLQAAYAPACHSRSSSLIIRLTFLVIAVFVFSHL